MNFHDQCLHSHVSLNTQMYWLTQDLIFPPVEKAEVWGGLALGGDLSPERLLLAYCSGIFPWYETGQPIIWHAPDPRFVLFPANLKVSKSMRPVLNRQRFSITYDRHFEAVMRHCQQQKRKGQQGTWITEDMVAAYVRLHQLGYAHSVEAWQEDTLVGGLYGIALGSVFFGESMFSEVSNASKAAFITLVQQLQPLGFTLIDCQVHTTHLESLGAEDIPRYLYMQLLEKGIQQDTVLPDNWRKPTYGG